MERICVHCSATFVISDDDLAFLEKMSPVIAGETYTIPPPTRCPECRRQRQLAIRNERKLYHRKSALSGKQIIALYSPEKPYKVFDQAEWWGDSWDAMEFGRNIDFHQPFFPQIAALRDLVPQVNLFNMYGENADYCNFCIWNKDCYLIFGSDKNNDCFHSHWIYQCTDIVDCAFSYNSELLYACVDCVQCHHCEYCQDCHNSSDCFLCFDLKGCRNCACSVGLRQKEYCVFNEQVSPEEFEAFVRKRQYVHQIKRFNDLRNTTPHRSLHAINAEHVSGDFIVNSKDVFHSFDIRNSQSIRHSNDLFDQAKDCMDCSFSGEAELCYDSYEVKGFRLLFCNRVWWHGYDCMYLDNCDACKNCFGCVGLRRQQYCILNKQYTKEQYEALVGRLIEHMRQSGEWGEFFPVTMSPFGYNETSAHEYFPMSEQEVKKKGWAWYTAEKTAEQYLGPTVKVPDDIGAVSDDIIQSILTCDITGKPYKITPQELVFYRKMNIPLPRICPDQRHKERIAMRNPRKLWKRDCTKCQKEIETTFAPDRPEIVYCESCYLASIS